MGLIPQPVQKDAVPLCRDKAGDQRDKGAKSRNKKGQSGQHRLPPQPLPGSRHISPPTSRTASGQPPSRRPSSRSTSAARPTARQNPGHRRAQGQRRDSAGEDRQGQHQGPDAAAAGIGQVIPPGLQQQTANCQVSQGGCGGGQPIPAQDGPRQPRSQHRRQGRQPSGLFPPDQQAQAQGRCGGGYGENRQGQASRPGAATATPRPKAPPETRRPPAGPRGRRVFRRRASLFGWRMMVFSRYCALLIHCWICWGICSGVKTSGSPPCWLHRSTRAFSGRSGGTRQHRQITVPASCQGGGSDS